MKQNVMLTITSLLSILLMTLHLSDDIVRGFEKGGVSNLLAVPILVTWLYGTLVLAERRSGYVIVLLGSLLGTGVPIIHFRGSGGRCRRRDRQVQRRLLLRMDAHRARCDVDVLPCPLGARTVAPEAGPASVAWQRPNMRMKLLWHGGRLKGKGSILIAAAAPRGLSAIR